MTEQDLIIENDHLKQIISKMRVTLETQEIHEIKEIEHKKSVHLSTLSELEKTIKMPRQILT